MIARWHLLCAFYLSLIEFHDRARVPLLGESALGNGLISFGRFIGAHVRLSTFLYFFPQICLFDQYIRDLRDEDARFRSLGQLFSLFVTDCGRLFRLVDCHIDVIRAFGGFFSETKQ